MDSQDTTKPNIKSMNKIKSLDDLRKMKQSLENGMNIREKSNSPDSLVQIRVAMATCGIAAGARTVMNALIEKIEKEKIPAVVTQGGCMGYCYAEPTIEVKVPGKDPVVFGNVDAQVAVDIIEKYVLKGELLDGIIPTNYQTINQ
ncbi:(2Fe-2S) ferredoxin domain-containing protein [Bacteroidota bacterium]